MLEGMQNAASDVTGLMWLCAAIVLVCTALNFAWRWRKETLTHLHVMLLGCLNGGALGLVVACYLDPVARSEGYSVTSSLGAGLLSIPGGALGWWLGGRIRCHHSPPPEAK